MGDLPELIVALLCASRKLNPLFLRKQNKNHDDLAACSKSRYSAILPHAAGALISLALPLGRAQRPSSFPELSNVEAGAA